jgi:hypothetical protein
MIFVPKSNAQDIIAVSCLSGDHFNGCCQCDVKLHGHFDKIDIHGIEKVGSEVYFELDE